VSQALQTLRRLAARPPTKARLAVVSTSSPDPWRLEVSRWSEEDRFEWEERVAIMLTDAGLSVGQAERAAFLDVCLYRTATR